MPLALLLFALAAICGWSCEHKPPAPSTSPAPTPAPAIQRNQHTTSGDAFLHIATSIDRADITVADRLRFTLTCTTRRAATLTLPDFPAQFGDFTLVSSSKDERLSPSGDREITVQLVLEPFLAGAKTIPSISVQAIDTTRTLKLKTEPALVQVAAVADPAATDKTPLEAAKAPVALIVPTTPNRFTLWATLGCALLASATALCFATLSSSRRAKREADPAFRAGRDLENVRAKLARSTTSTHAGECCEELFLAFAPYLDAALGIPAGTQPHAAIAAAIATSPRLSFEDRTELNSLLADLERTRFAPGGASIPIVQSLLARAATFVGRASQQGGRS